MANLTRPRQQQRYFGPPPAPFGAGGYGGVGATMAPPMPAAPRTTGAGAAAVAPYMPTPAPQVTTNPRLTPFQLSVNNQRATESRKAATFAAGAPLPYSPASSGPSFAGSGPVSVPGAGQMSTSPVNLAPLATPQPTDTPAPFVSGAPAGQQYSGAFGTGPQAEQSAMAARTAYIQSHEDTANAQDRGPGLGVNSYANADFQRDANQRANDAADNPNAKDQYYEAGAAERLARANTLIPAQADRATEQGKNLATKTEGEKQLQPGRVEQQGVKTTAIKQTGDAAQSRAFTAAQAQQDKKLSEQVKTIEQKLRSDNRLDATAKRAMLHQKIGFLTQKMKIAIAAGNRTDDKGGINDQIGDAIKELQPSAAAPATQPAAGGEGTQPGASAVPEHVNPATGQRANWDPSKREWVIT